VVRRHPFALDRCFRAPELLLGSARCRMAYDMVRLQELSYEETAACMGVSIRTVGKYIVHAHRVFRNELRLAGIAVGATGAGKEQAESTGHAVETRFAPGYVALPPAHIAGPVAGTKGRKADRAEVTAGVSPVAGSPSAPTVEAIRVVARQRWLPDAASERTGDSVAQVAGGN
jgi:hypothetical protein